MAKVTLSFNLTDAQAAELRTAAEGGEGLTLSTCAMTIFVDPVTVKEQ